MSNLQPLRWDGETAYCGKAQIGFALWNGGIPEGRMNLRFAGDCGFEFFALPATLDDARKWVESEWAKIAADLTAQPEVPKVKAWWDDHGHGRFSLMADLDPDDDSLERLGSVHSDLSGWLWRTTGSFHFADSESAAKTALLAATNAVVDSPNLDQIDTAGNGHDQTQGD